MNQHGELPHAPGVEQPPGVVTVAHAPLDAFTPT
jgi:hypothetical protein